MDPRHIKILQIIKKLYIKKNLILPLKVIRILKKCSYHYLFDPLVVYL